ncbi:nitrous oxide reductase accessory protein NosL [Virgibacillus sp. YIM 98842]|uniref:nitrous oxide reductase accessory protein NosL n=1 Tax=Virgibacillus sp. YIM 98842 TaxID=2663533 RepID=UPI0013DCE4F4|nr:nitrous oxide reductase accessory protein NosL [Virgibacillus sp. YIM 98842]
MKKAAAAIIAMVMIGLLTACGGTSYEPVDISQDTDQCYTCHMGIEDLDSASQTILTDGTPRIFDDIGCMLVYLQDNDDEVEVSYVRDHHSGDWIDMADAYFIHDESIQTPMSYGFIAFSSEQEAEDYLSESDQGEMLSSQEITSIDEESLETWYKGHQEGHDHGEHDDHADEDEHDDMD